MFLIARIKFFRPCLSTVQIHVAELRYTHNFSGSRVKLAEFIWLGSVLLLSADK